MSEAAVQSLQLAKRARLLSWVSLLYMLGEGAVALAAGEAAGSIALVAFGIGSLIEGLASLVIVWRFTGSRINSASAEGRAQKIVAIQFFLLVPYIAVEAVQKLVTGEHPAASLVGIVLALISVALMPILGIAKQRISRQLHSRALKGEGAQNILCALQAGVLLVGLAGNAAFGVWWLDPVAALVIAAIALKEGLEAWRGDDCLPVAYGSRVSAGGDS